MPFKPDPAGRTWVEKVSRTLELIIPFRNNLATLMTWWEENWDKLDVWAESIVKKLNTKMDKTNPVYEGSLNGFKTDYLVIPNNIINTDTRIQIVNKMQEKHLFTYKTDDNVFPNALPSTASKKGVLEVIKVTGTVGYFTYKEDGEIGDVIYTSVYNNGKVTDWTANKGDGYNSIPSGGSANKFLKWAASGVAQWANITWEDVIGKPTTYNPPVATSTILGGIKVGSNLSIVNGVLSANVDPTTCFIPIGFIIMTDDNRLNPATLFPGTTWGRIAENRSIRGATSSDGVGVVGGSDTVGIAQANLPAVNLWAHDHSHTRGGMDIWGNVYSNLQKNDDSPRGDGAFSLTNVHTGTFSGGGVNIGTGNITFQASRAWSGATSGASTTCVPLGGSNIPINVTNSFYKIHIWKRLS